VVHTIAEGVSGLYICACETITNGNPILKENNHLAIGSLSGNRLASRNRQWRNTGAGVTDSGPYFTLVQV
jgi:hypothetical protein